jgi:hypothetical protein
LYVFLFSYTLLQVNGIEKKSICLPRHELDKLTPDDALELAMSQSALHSYTSGYNIVSAAWQCLSPPCTVTHQDITLLVPPSQSIPAMRPSLTSEQKEPAKRNISTGKMVEV